MWLLITFITLWAISPGPVFVLTLHESRKHGAWSGIAIAAGAAATSVLMVLTALLIHATGFLAVLDSPSMVLVERFGAIGIIIMGVTAGYKCLTSTEQIPNSQTISTRSQISFVQGMCIMLTSIPHALLFYNVIMPQTVSPDAMFSSIVALGSLKVLMILGFHAGVAVAAAHSQKLGNRNRFQRPIEFGLASLLVAMGTNMLL